MVKVDRRMEMADLGDDPTEGQFADFVAAELSGDMGAWGIGVVEYRCEKCSATVELTREVLADYRALIDAWHERAASGDYFSRYTCDYIALSAFLKDDVAIGASSDRQAIQRLKQNAELESRFLRKIKKDHILRRNWRAVVDELKRRPLQNSSRDYDNPEVDDWWNSDRDRPNHGSKKQKGVVHSLNDWPNMVEFWYATRNNLVHGGKNPNLPRDVFLVEHAFKTLNAFISMVLEG